MWATHGIWGSMERCCGFDPGSHYRCCPDHLGAWHLLDLSRAGSRPAMLKNSRLKKRRRLCEEIPLLRNLTLRLVEFSKHSPCTSHTLQIHFIHDSYTLHILHIHVITYTVNILHMLFLRTGWPSVLALSKAQILIKNSHNEARNPPTGGFWSCFYAHMIRRKSPPLGEIAWWGCSFRCCVAAHCPFCLYHFLLLMHIALWHWHVPARRSRSDTKWHEVTRSRPIETCSHIASTIHDPTLGNNRGTHRLQGRIRWRSCHFAPPDWSTCLLLSKHISLRIKFLMNFVSYLLFYNC